MSEQRGPDKSCSISMEDSSTMEKSSKYLIIIYFRGTMTIIVDSRGTTTGRTMTLNGNFPFWGITDDHVWLVVA